MRRSRRSHCSTHSAEALRLDTIKKNEYSFFIPKLAQAILDERRRHILLAAELCFARDGFHRTTIADVKKQAGVSTGAVYTYFRNKEEMIAAILEGAREKRRRQLEDSTANGANDRILVLLQWITAIFETDGLHAARVDVNLWAEALRSRRVEKLARAALGEAGSTVSKVIAPRLPRSSGTSLPDPESVASVLIALFLGLEVQVAVGMPVDAAGVLGTLGVLFRDYLPGKALPAQAKKKGRASPRRRKA